MSTASRWRHWALWQPRHYWAFALVVVGLVSAGWWFPITEKTVRIAALMLQLVGFVLVFKGIDSTLGSFGQTRLLPTLWNWMRTWWGDRPFLKRTHIISATGFASGTSFARARATVNAGPNTPLERRVELLEQKMAQTSREIDELHDSLEAAKKDLGSRIDSATESLRKEAEEMAQRLRAKFVDGIGSELLGVALFVIGTIMGSLPQEIADCLT